MKRLKLLWETFVLTVTMALMATMGCASANGDEWVDGEGVEAPEGGLTPEIGEAKQALGLLQFAPTSGDLFFYWEMRHGEQGPVYQADGGPVPAGWNLTDYSWVDYGLWYSGRVVYEPTIPHKIIVSGPRINGGCPPMKLRQWFHTSHDEWESFFWVPFEDVTTTGGNAMMCAYEFNLGPAHVEQEMGWTDPLFGTVTRDYDCMCDSWLGVAFYDADVPSECPWGCIPGPEGIGYTP